MAKRKAKVDKDGYVHFLNDKDGLSSKDYILILSTGVFFIFIAIGLIMALFKSELSKSYLDLLEITVPIVMTVVGGTMGVQAVESFSKGSKRNMVDEEEELY